MIEFTITGAFIVGLMGAGHCIGMCGGLVGAFSQQLSNQPNHNMLASQLSFIFSYNLGRVLSYTLAGALVGGSASLLSTLFSLDSYLIAVRVFAGLMMIITGLYIAQIWSGVVQVERLGKLLWRAIGPIAKRLLPIKNLKQSFIAGLLWGWLPCGLVYSTLTWAIAANNAQQGALIMAAFGLGTLPALISAGVAAQFFAKWVLKKQVRMISGLILVIFGLQTLYIAFGQLS
ncbi:sulfite exporter TauE/SafE family protein [Shewanella sp. Isolate11]|uniref:sulfite exporter TauE/SafE family protein n=1 Tax=Shewanella sp. Isolate11 TaxID=2908530 RepID=UPI001EFEB445|nr:sulfite exporter TauE/SafE family protein [Shewanella sp. Isolate11]MCG9696672.1 sulfite exporter TauE/SafE family protein [Shewanella sp. Isolate11]